MVLVWFLSRKICWWWVRVGDSKRLAARDKERLMLLSYSGVENVNPLNAKLERRSLLVLLMVENRFLL